MVLGLSPLLHVVRYRSLRLETRRGLHRADPSALPLALLRRPAQPVPQQGPAPSHQIREHSVAHLDELGSLPELFGELLCPGFREERSLLSVSLPHCI